MCVIFGADITNGHSVSGQMDGERDILTFKGYSNIYIQHVSKSAASTELTGQIKGVGEIPIPLLHSISVSFEIYGYPTISPIGRIKVTVSYLHCEGGKDKTFSFGIKLDSPNLANQKSHGGDRKTSDKICRLNQSTIMGEWTYSQNGKLNTISW